VKFKEILKKKIQNLLRKPPEDLHS